MKYKFKVLFFCPESISLTFISKKLTKIFTALKLRQPIWVKKGRCFKWINTSIFFFTKLIFFIWHFFYTKSFNFVCKSILLFIHLYNYNDVRIYLNPRLELQLNDAWSYVDINKNQWHKLMVKKSIQNCLTPYGYKNDRQECISCLFMQIIKDE